jgi:LysM repeat protein
MKILKIFGVVVGIHVVALIMIFANPGCSSNSKQPPAPSDTVITSTEPAAPKIVVPASAAAATESLAVSAVPLPAGDTSPVIAAPMLYGSAAPASVTVRYTPTRPGTAAAGTLEAAPPADIVATSTYTVGKGDSLWTIAKKNHLTVSELAAANNVKSGAIVHVGQKLLIPSRPVPGLSASAPAPKTPAPAPDAASGVAKTGGDTVRHVVKPNETLGAIARKYGVKIGDIETANTITDPKRIRPGMELVIPGWQAPAGKAAKPAASAPAPVRPAPAQPQPELDLDAGLKSTSAPPVIQIEETSPRKKP